MLLFDFRLEAGSVTTVFADNEPIWSARNTKIHKIISNNNYNGRARLATTKSVVAHIVVLSPVNKIYSWTHNFDFWFLIPHLSVPPCDAPSCVIWFRYYYILLLLLDVRSVCGILLLVHVLFARLYPNKCKAMSRPVSSPSPVDDDVWYLRFMCAHRIRRPPAPALVYCFQFNCFINSLCLVSPRRQKFPRFANRWKISLEIRTNICFQQI